MYDLFGLDIDNAFVFDFHVTYGNAGVVDTSTALTPKLWKAWFTLIALSVNSSGACLRLILLSQ